MKPGNDAYLRALRLPMSMDYSPEWMIQPVPAPTDTAAAPAGQAAKRSIPVRERRVREDRRRVERRHKR
jgi:hypothetical protein